MACEIEHRRNVTALRDCVSDVERLQITVAGSPAYSDGVGWCFRRCPEEVTASTMVPRRGQESVLRAPRQQKEEE